MIVTGTAQVNRQLNRIIGQMILEAEKAAVLTQDQVVRRAVQLAPIGTPSSTGDPNYIVAQSYQRSIRREPPSKTPGKFVAPVVAGRFIINPNTGGEVDYSLTLERGHSSQAPRGVMEPALRSQVRFFAREVLRGIRRVR